MAEIVRLDIKLHVSRVTAATIERLASERNVPRNTLVLQALGILHVLHDARKGGKHVGIAVNREDLETVLLDAVI